MPAFLATTALDDFWDRDGEILFLGSWCLLHDRRERWEHLRYTILTSPWNDRSRFAAAAEYVDAVAERMLPRLADYLNAVHDERHALRYWRILLGPWLMQTTHAMYDRYELLRDAMKRQPFVTIGLDAAAYRVPRTTLEHIAWLSEDLYNLQLFTQILEQLGVEATRRGVTPLVVGFSHQMERHRDARAIGLHGSEKKPTTKGVTPRRFAGVMFEAVMRGAASRGAVALHDMYADRSQRISLALRSGGKVIPIEPRAHDVSASASFDVRRTQLSALPAHDDFERALVGLLPHLLPVAYLEGYGELHATTPKAAAFATASGWYSHESTKLAAARAAEDGKKLIAIQHGGGYGVYRHAPVEAHEKRIADRFLVWGWAAQDPTKLRNIPAAKLSAVCRKIGSRKESEPRTDVLFLATVHPRYLFRFHSAPVGSQWDEYFAWEDRFLGRLPQNVARNVVYRGYAHDWGHAVEHRMSPASRSIRRESHGSAIAAFLRSRIVVIDHCATGYLETLAMNVPTILFWDAQRWEIRDAARESFDALREAKILFATPEDAADHLAAVYENPDPWWRDDALQAVRRRFVATFAATQPDWERAWTRALSEEAACA